MEMAMKPDAKVKFGRVDLEVTPFGFGTAPIGNIFREIDEETSDAMIQEAWNQGVRYFDTAPMYGHGLSELRTGYSLRWKNRDDFVLSSKVGRVLKPARKADIDFDGWCPPAIEYLPAMYIFNTGHNHSFQRLLNFRQNYCRLHLRARIILLVKSR